MPPPSRAWRWWQPIVTTEGTPAITRPSHLTTRHFQGPYVLRFRLWLRTRQRGALLLAPFRLTGSGAKQAMRNIEIGPGTRIGQFAWFSLVRPSARVTIGRDCTLSASLGLSVQDSIVIGDGTAIGERCLIVDHGHDHLTYLEASLAGGGRPAFGWETSAALPVVIGHGVHIGVNVVILPGVHIGDGAVVGANSVVTHSVDAYTVVAGAPARLLRRFEVPDGDVVPGGAG